MFNSFWLPVEVPEAQVWDALGWYAMGWDGIGVKCGQAKPS